MVCANTSTAPVPGEPTPPVTKIPRIAAVNYDASIMGALVLATTVRLLHVLPAVGFESRIQLCLAELPSFLQQCFGDAWKLDLNLACLQGTAVRLAAHDFAPADDNTVSRLPFGAGDDAADRIQGELGTLLKTVFDIIHTVAEEDAKPKG